MKISASIYSSKNGDLKSLIKELNSMPIDFIHIDCNDDPKVFLDITEIREHTQKPIDLHIISPNPENYFDLIIKHQPEYLTFQYEPVKRFIKIPKEIKSITGIAVTTDSPIEVFDEFADSFDFIMFMATTPGQSSGRFQKNNFKRIRSFRNKYPAKRIHVDGGVNGEVSFILRNIGVNAAVSGSFLLGAEHMGHALFDLKLNSVDSSYQVKDFMIPAEEIQLITPENFTFRDILLSIENNRLGFTVFVDDGGVMQGLTTNADVRRGLLKHITDFNNLKAEDVLNRNPVAVSEDLNVTGLLQFIQNQKFPINYLPVVNNANRVTGALTFVDLIKGE